jgi:hypothetical protein
MVGSQKLKKAKRSASNSDTQDRWRHIAALEDRSRERSRTSHTITTVGHGKNSIFPAIASVFFRSLL